MKEGWLCPRCGRINSPFISKCDCYNTNTCADHEWKFCGISTYGYHYQCKKCGRIKIIPYDSKQCVTTS